MIAAAVLEPAILRGRADLPTKNRCSPCYAKDQAARTHTRVRTLLGVIQIAGAQQVCEVAGGLRKPWHFMSHRDMPSRVAVCDEFSTLFVSFRLY